MQISFDWIGQHIGANISEARRKFDVLIALNKISNCHFEPLWIALGKERFEVFKTPVSTIAFIKHAVNDLSGSESEMFIGFELCRPARYAVKVSA